LPFAVSIEVHAVNNLKSLLAGVLVIALVLVSSPFQLLQALPAPAANIPQWPKVFDRNGAHIVVYQPQVRSWRSYRSLIAGTAISVTPPGGQPILGVISWHADTITVVSSRTVFVMDIEVVSCLLFLTSELLAGRPGLEPG
jgi:hypothetical protein